MNYLPVLLQGTRDEGWIGWRRGYGFFYFDMSRKQEPLKLSCPIEFVWQTWVQTEDFPAFQILWILAPFKEKVQKVGKGAEG